MTILDVDYIKRVFDHGAIHSPVLELGTGWGGITSREVVMAGGLKYVGTDVAPGPGVDVAADFENESDVTRLAAHGPFGSVLVLNVLEHTFDPIRILDNAIRLVRTGGSLVVLTPAVWPLHNYPLDAWRILPNFYEEYAKRRGHKLVPELFEYVGQGLVPGYRSADNTYSFPPPAVGIYRLYCRIIHRLFRTYGRGMSQLSHIAVGAVIIKSNS